MRRWEVFLVRLRALRNSDAVHREIDEEVSFHLDMRTEENVRKGMSHEEARQEAEKRFGRLTRIKEMGYEVRGGGWLESLWQDLRYGLRTLRQNPVFTLIAVATLALGIGANTAIFSVVNAVLLQPLPYANANELSGIYLSTGGESVESRFPFSPAAYINLKTHNAVFTDIAALSNKGWPANLTGAGAPERLQGFQVSANLFPLLGVNAALGRTFVAEEDQPGPNRVVVLSHALWKRRFGGDRDILGSKLNLNGETYTVVGVLPSD